MLGVGVWTVVEKGNYLSLLTSSTFAVSAYTLIVAGGLVVVTGFLGCCAVIREQKICLSVVRWRFLHLILSDVGEVPKRSYEANPYSKNHHQPFWLKDQKKP